MMRRPTTPEQKRGWRQTPGETHMKTNALHLLPDNATKKDDTESDKTGKTRLLCQTSLYTGGCLRAVVRADIYEHVEDGTLRAVPRSIRLAGHKVPIPEDGKAIPGAATTSLTQVYEDIRSWANRTVYDWAAKPVLLIVIFCLGTSLLVAALPHELIRSVLNGDRHA